MIRISIRPLLAALCAGLLAVPAVRAAEPVRHIGIARLGSAQHSGQGDGVGPGDPVAQFFCKRLRRIGDRADLETGKQLNQWGTVETRGWGKLALRHCEISAETVDFTALPSVPRTGTRSRKLAACRGIRIVAIP